MNMTRSILKERHHPLRETVTSTKNRRSTSLQSLLPGENSTSSSNITGNSITTSCSSSCTSIMVDSEQNGGSGGSSSLLQDDSENGKQHPSSLYATVRRIRFCSPIFVRLLLFVTILIGIVVFYTTNNSYNQSSSLSYLLRKTTSNPGIVPNTSSSTSSSSIDIRRKEDDTASSHSSEDSSSSGDNNNNSKDDNKSKEIDDESSNDNDNKKTKVDDDENPKKTTSDTNKNEQGMTPEEDKKDNSNNNEIDVGSITTTNTGSNDKNHQDPIVIVIISDRVSGIISAIATVLKHSSKSGTTKPVQVVVIGNATTNEQVETHFGTRLSKFIGLTVDDVTKDITSNTNFQPTWTWDTWHSSMTTNTDGTTSSSSSWYNDNTIHPGTWDYRRKHSLVMNQIVFYIPHLTLLKDNQYIYIMEDDVLVQTDLSTIQDKVTQSTDNSAVAVVAPCSAWIWQDTCQNFEFYTEQDTILKMPALYGGTANQRICQSPEDIQCIPSNYNTYIKDILGNEYYELAEKQPGWSFGFTFVALSNWRSLRITERYTTIMESNYKLHVFPETSLSFGLGIPYLALAGAVQCWDESYINVRDGFGFIDWSRMQQTFGSTTVYDKADIIHHNGFQKPWEDNYLKEIDIVQPWYTTLQEEKIEKLPEPLSEQNTKPNTNLFMVLGGGRTGGHYIMSTLDNDPTICATGEHDNGESGYPAEIMYPHQMEWYPTCSIKRGCSYSFVRDSILDLTKNTNKCQADYDTKSDPLKNHLVRLCNFLNKLNNDYSIDTITKQWVDAFVNEDKELLGCNCPRGIQAKGIKLLSDWVHYKGYPYEETGPADLNLDNTKFLVDKDIKILRIKRSNLWSRYKSMEIARTTEVYWHVTNANEKKQQLATLKEKTKSHHGGITIDLLDLKENIQYMQNSDRAGDEWALNNTKPENILWLEYDDCKHDAFQCFTKIYKFLDVEMSARTVQRIKLLASSQQNYISDASIVNIDRNLEYIRNKEYVKDLFIEQNWTHWLVE